MMTNHCARPCVEGYIVVVYWALMVQLSVPCVAMCQFLVNHRNVKCEIHTGVDC